MRGLIQNAKIHGSQNSYKNFLNSANHRFDKSNKGDLTFLLKQWQEKTSRYDSNIIISNLKAQPGMNSKLKLRSKRSRQRSEANLEHQYSSQIQ